MPATSEPRKGRLLVATPALVEPTFAHTVVLLLDHDAGGTVGVVLNRPTEVPVREALPQWHGVVADPPAVFAGGPVQADAVIVLAGVDASGPGVQAVSARLSIVDPSLLPTGAQVRVFAGYAGWSAGQLQGEIAAGGWFVVDGEPGDAFSAAPDELWVAVLRRQGGLFSTVSPDPTLN